MKTINELKDIVIQIRRDILRMVHANSSGHPGGSLGCAEFLSVLYFYTMNHSNDFSMDGKNEDIFFLSNGHISPVFYSVLSRCGYFNIKELATFRKINSRLQGHPTPHEKLEGVRMASGSLGQGLSTAIGAALTKKLNNDQNFIDYERVFSNLIKYLKEVIFFFSEKLFFKIKRYFIKKI